jgi:hypothetical protein
LFDSDRVPADAGSHIRRFHGLLFGIRNSSRLARQHALLHTVLKPHALIAVRGTLFCDRSPGLPELQPVMVSVTLRRAALSNGSLALRVRTV